MRHLIWIVLLCLAWPSLGQQFIRNDNIIVLQGDGVASGDIDSDGDEDVICLGLRHICWVENLDGQGQFSSLKILFERPSDIDSENVIISDVDSDGDLDVLIDNGIRWVENMSGDATDWKQHIMELEGGAGALDIHKIVDFDNDSDVDLIYYSQEDIIIHENEFGVFQSRVLWTLSGTKAYDIDVLDFDNDSDNDLIYLWSENQLNSEAYLLENNGNDSISNSYFLLDSISSENKNYFIGNFDFDNNGYNDIFILDYTQIVNKILVYKNIDGKSLEYFSVFDDNISKFEKGIVSDVDSDSDFDLILSSNWLKNTGGDLVIEEIQGFSSNLNFYTASIDLDNSSGDEYIFSNKFKNELSICRYNNSIEELELIDSIQNGSQDDVYKDNSLSDLDNDGDLDAITFTIFNSDNILRGYDNMDSIGNYDNGMVIAMIDSVELNDINIGDIDQDGSNDIIWSGDKVYMLKNQNGTGDFTNPELVRDERAYYLNLKDLDSDEDLDLVYFTRPTSSIVDSQLKWCKHENEEYSGCSVLASNLLCKDIVCEDLNGDNLIDIIITEETNNTIGWFKNLGGSGDFSGFIPISQPSNSEFEKILITDIDGDNDLDIVSSLDGLHEEIVWFENIDGSGNFNSSYQIVDPENVLEQINLFENLHGEDFNNDGYGDFLFIDIYQGLNFYNYNGSNSFNKELIDSHFSTYSYVSAIIFPGDIDNDGDTDYLAAAFTVDGKPVWYRNTLIHDYWLNGNVFNDIHENCSYNDTLDHLLSNWVISAIRDDGVKFYSNTDSLGNYSMPIDSGNFTLNIIPPNDYWTPCFQDSMIYMPPGGDTIHIDFPVQAEFDCPVLSVNMDTWAIRPCFESTFTVHYCNDGTLTAEDAYIEVAFDSILTVNNSSLPWSSVQGNSYTFEIGDVEIGECDQFYIYADVDCEAEVGEINCADAHIFPDSLCNFPLLNWDGSNVTISGECEGDSITFTIQNTGTGDMQMPLDYIIQIVNDDIVVFLKADTFQLNAGEMATVTAAASGLALKMEAEQSLNNPAASDPIIVVPICDSLGLDSIFFILNQFPVGSGDPFGDQACLPVTASFDPNDKQAFPAGFGPDHLVEPDWEIEYLIRFQNTGTDTAFKVVIRDTLSPSLNPSTVRPGAASHPYTWDLTGEGVLSFTFDNILLPDSTTNEPESHGFISFTIEQDEDILPGTVFENTAFIYFDFNDPIMTNTTFHEVIKPVVHEVAFLEFCGETNWNGMVVTSDTLLTDTTFFPEYDSITLFNTTVHDNYLLTFDTVLHQWEMWNGQYFQMDTSLVDSMLTIQSCDSVIVTNINAIPLTYSELEAMICEGDEWEGVVYLQDTLLVDTLISNVEDTIFLTDLIVEETYETTIDTVMPYGDPYFSDTTIVLDLIATNGCDSIVTLNVSVTTGTNNLQYSNESMTIHPNPTNGHVYCFFKNKSPVIKSVSIWSATGKALMNIPIHRRLTENTPLLVDLSDMPVGLYLLKFISDESIWVNKSIRSD